MEFVFLDIFTLQSCFQDVSTATRRSLEEQPRSMRSVIHTSCYNWPHTAVNSFTMLANSNELKCSIWRRRANVLTKQRRLFYPLWGVV